MDLQYTLHCTSYWIAHCTLCIPIFSALCTTLCSVYCAVCIVHCIEGLCHVNSPSAAAACPNLPKHHLYPLDDSIQRKYCVHNHILSLLCIFFRRQKIECCPNLPSLPCLSSAQQILLPQCVWGKTLAISIQRTNTVCTILSQNYCLLYPNTVCTMIYLISIILSFHTSDNQTIPCFIPEEFRQLYLLRAHFAQILFAQWYLISILLTFHPSKIEWYPVLCRQSSTQH